MLKMQGSCCQHQLARSCTHVSVSQGVHEARRAALGTQARRALDRWEVPVGCATLRAPACLADRYPLHVT